MIVVKRSGLDDGCKTRPAKFPTEIKIVAQGRGDERALFAYDSALEALEAHEVDSCVLATYKLVRTETVEKTVRIKARGKKAD